MSGNEVSAAGPWSPWWCRAHNRDEDPSPVTPARICGECGHVYLCQDDISAASRAWPGQQPLCGFCLTRWEAPPGQ